MAPQRINVTKSFLPPIEDYEEYTKQIWQSDWLTNQGPLLQDFETKIQSRFNIENFHFVSNGTTALQLSIRALDLSDCEIITTPFSYVATTSSILWEHCIPVFADIDPNTLCLDPNKLEALITDKTRAIMPVHVFGNPCDVESIQAIADKHNLKVIYDAAHAFDSKYKQKSLFEYGDISIGSFHATKLFHTIEGGGVFTKDEAISQKVDLLKRFGHNFDEHIMLGINGKTSEFNAAMGLCNLKYMNEIIETRSKLVNLYNELLGDIAFNPKFSDFEPNYAYYPYIAQSEDELLNTIEALNHENIYPRRYFYPSLNRLTYLSSTQDCPISEDIASRIVCLPLYVGLAEEAIHTICKIINDKRL